METAVGMPTAASAMFNIVRQASARSGLPTNKREPNTARSLSSTAGTYKQLFSGALTGPAINR